MVEDPLSECAERTPSMFARDQGWHHRSKFLFVRVVLQRVVHCTYVLACRRRAKWPKIENCLHFQIFRALDNYFGVRTIP